jgi:hypothetical protein
MTYNTLTMVELRDMRIDAESELNQIKKKLNGIDAEIESRVKPLINGFGTVHRDVEGIPIKITNTKKVDWDQEKLAEKYKSMLEHNFDPTPYLSVDTTYKVSETAYKNWSEELKESFGDARTEKTGSLKIEFMEGK